MCGIAGFVLAGGAPPDARVAHTMTRMLAHRGPDGQGVHTEPGVALGHRRLSILDLSDNASQPMRDEAGRTLVFNGELYNFAAVREVLRSLGHSFRSTGDTEVLLRALGQWGPEALERFHGMLALAHWERDARTLLLARDRFGKKPLYYAPFGPEGREGLAFASELRALLAHPRVWAEREVDTAALAQYLLHEYIPAPRSALRNVRKLLPGEQLLWRDGEGLRTSRFYNLRWHRDTRGSEKELCAQFLDVVTEATRDRLVADVPVGVFLSGGLDSSLLAACAVRAHPRVKTFSIAFDDPTFDESEHARAVARHLGTQHTEERISEGDLLSLVPSTLDWIDEPFADGSLVPTSLLARITRPHVTVVLGGDGGDELLAGYPTFWVDRALRAVPALPQGLTRLLLRAARRVPPEDGSMSLAFRLQQFAQGLGASGAERHARWLAPMPPEDALGLLGPLLRREPFPEQNLWEPTRAAVADTRNPFDAATAFYLRMYLAEGVLTKVDRATMRYSLEARAPLLDTRVVQWCLGLDPALRLKGRTTKYLMRRALRGLLPASILERPKKGFGAPLGRWLRGPLSGL